MPRRRYAYYLTPQGFAEKSRLTATYLADSFSLFRMARSQCGDVFAAAAARGQKRLALLGHGDLAEIAHLVARDHGIKTFTLIVLPENQQMLGLLRTMGWIHHARLSGGVYDISFDLPDVT